MTTLEETHGYLSRGVPPSSFFLQDKVTRQEIDQVWEQFKRLDKNNSGFLELDEVCAEPEMKKKDC